MQIVSFPGFILKDLMQHTSFLWRKRDFKREHVRDARFQTSVEPSRTVSPPESPSETVCRSQETPTPYTRACFYAILQNPHASACTLYNRLQTPGPVLSSVQLANAFFTGGLLTTSEAQALMRVFPQAFGAQYTRRMAAKLGLREFDGEFTTALLALMKRDKVDFTNLFRALGDVTTGLDVGSAKEEELLAPIEGVLREGGVKGDWAQWMRIYIVKVGRRCGST